ncbi:MAG TPA: alkaline phosphatase family protein [Longimicrobiales bacterium]|nr:alkaline phosphatase family protein [Longimicrobiales bacterium]
MHSLLLFLDGVGLGDADPDTNPFMTASLPALHGALGVAPLTLAAAPHHGAHASLVAIDAPLGCAGVPQSGTGQAALLTGTNAALVHGRHFGPWVPARLRACVRDESLLARAVPAGHRVAFANAYPEEVLRVDAGDDVPSDAPARPGRMRRAPQFLRAGPPLAALGAGVLTRHTPSLERGDAVASEITNEAWRERLGRNSVPSIDAATAGRNLARIVMQHDLTLFAHYATDYAGHAADMASAVAALERVDAFVGGLLADADTDMLVVIASDHGNIEDVRTGHTRNPAIGIVIGAGHALLARRLRSLTDVTPAILDRLGLAV